MSSSSLRAGAMLIAAAAVSAGCVAHVHLVRVPRAIVSTEGVTITALDGSFTLQPGRASRTPFHSSDCVVHPVSENYAYGESMGARRVRVQYPGMAAPLYGMLAFCPVNEDAANAGPISRSHAIRIPPNYVQETADGRITVVYEPYGWNVRVRDRDHEVPAWVLWLSREPFPGGG